MIKAITVKNWKYRQAGSEKWKQGRKDAAKSEIQAELIANNEIPSPFIDCHARDIQWVGEKDWEYQSEFQVPKEDQKKRVQILEFNGLDTFCTVNLNGEEILKTDNMFIKYSVDVTKKLKYDEPNKLHLYFKSALVEARRLEKIHGKGHSFNGEVSRTQVRKAQYGWGWDWGDAVMTCGPWQPVRLLSYDAHLRDVYVKVVDPNAQESKIDVQAEIDAPKSADILLDVKVWGPNGNEIEIEPKKQLVSGAKLSVKFPIKEPELWFPRGKGKQPLYTFETTLYSSDGTILDKTTKKVGIRNVELVQEPLEDAEGTSFYFKVNGVPVYCNGSNWIPGHSIPCLFTDDDYKKWIQLAVDGNQNMIRVWGGGYYEDELFYSECDRLGIMVWQDFMFACAAYPAYPEFIASVQNEVETQLKRLRNHCCLSIFAGNNEDYQVAESCNLDWDKDDHSGDYTKTSFPARTIYEKTLPDLCAGLQPDVPYHPGSPWGGKDTSDKTVGDIHQWNVWHGSQEQYQNWYKLGGRFVSEFGMEALPSIKTYEDCITDPTELYAQSESVDFHNKADGFARRLALYVIENLKLQGDDFESMIYTTQLMQAECLSYAYKCWRRRWYGDGKRYSGGAIVWQLNDCCPIASWAIVDFYGRPKLSFYAVKRESTDVGVGMYRNEDSNHDNDSESGIGKPHNYEIHSYNVDIWGVNASLKNIPAKLLVDVYEVESGKLINSLTPADVVLKANQTTEFVKALHLPKGKKVVVYSRVEVDGKILATAADWPQPLKYLKFPDRHVGYEISDGSITLTANKPVKGVQVTVKNRDVFLQDNGFDIFPGDKVVVKGDIKKTDNIGIRYYNM
ncbi:man9 [Brettanomyces bruxellensis]|uniref:Beta-mannosidase B n=1 Tax=Dekkera bruxellensis TaxID=5007 RepID=A0A7D9H1K7_DEKBR|nr:man9 [Brettanomyces bruxellensis]